jgi:hypothetical protein
LWLVSRYVTPAERRAAGPRRLAQHRQRAGGLPGIDVLADQALTAAKEQRIALPGERASAALIRELAQEAPATRRRIAELDRALETLLARHPEAALIRSLPGMGPR